jgi:lysophospholipase L1-like esterase
MYDKKILLLTDSLALPRDVPEQVKLEDTWPYLLKLEFGNYYFHQASKGGGTVNEIIHQLSYLKAFHPDVVIIQQGIVDCAPRALSKFEVDIFNNFRVTRYISNRLLKQNSVFLRKWRNITFTSKSKFSAAIDNLAESFGAEKMNWLGILPGSMAYDKKVPGIIININAYNQIIKNQLGNQYIDMEHFPKDGKMIDLFHLNKIGHRFIFEKLKALL